MHTPRLSKSARAQPGLAEPFRWRLAAMALLVVGGAYINQAQAACTGLLGHTFNSLQTGQPMNLCQYQGKVILVANTASYCGHTDQYGGLEALYRKYKSRGLVVLGFPSNDFGGQEPGSNKEIAKFCRLTYSVEFPMVEKSSVVGPSRNALFADLEQRTRQVPRWNFHKYLIDRDGQRVLSFESAIQPDDRRIVGELEKMLSAAPQPRHRT